MDNCAVDKRKYVMWKFVCEVESTLESGLFKAADDESSVFEIY